MSKHPDAIDDYNSSAWSALGHPAFDGDAVEWWGAEDE